MSDTEARLARLEQKLQSLQDYVAVCQIIARYGPQADTADTFERGQKVGDLWSEDGVYELGNGWAGKGRDGIAGLLDNDVHRALVREGAAHIPSMPNVTVDGDRACAVNYSRVYKHENGVFNVWRVSVNVWELARIDGTWKIQWRTNRLLNGSDDARAILRTIDHAEGLK
ncbi:nuclear transport factor 2 family protein [Brevundimonas sp. BH3]|uniref:nuclear transport factor 2 family protein n=1 Tax=Brevundimonas sp. BH3 TaxID=3133089 RepID=UPI003252D26A